MPKKPEKRVSKREILEGNLAENQIEEESRGGTSRTRSQTNMKTRRENKQGEKSQKTELNNNLGPGPKNSTAQSSMGVQLPSPEFQKNDRKSARKKSGRAGHSKKQEDLILTTATKRESVIPKIKETTKEVPVSSGPTRKYWARYSGNLAVKQFAYGPVMKAFRLCKRPGQSDTGSADNESNHDKDCKATVTDIHKRVSPEIMTARQFLRDFKLSNYHSGLDNKITALEWHPRNPRIVALGTKNGSFAVFNTSRPSESDDVVEAGPGPGYVISEIRFDPDNPHILYTANMDGHILKRNIVAKTADSLITISAENIYKQWWVSADVSSYHNILLAGDSKGYVTAITTDGADTIWKLRLNTQKVHHLEFSKREPWLFSSATTAEHCVKLWDIRMLKEELAGSNRPKPMISLPHKAAVNVGTFSTTGSNRLLTSDQLDECRVYKGPSWRLESIYKHPHRQFQHLIPIRASWHPLLDVGVIGRYPSLGNTSDLRTIDFFDAETGRELLRKVQPWGTKSLIVSIAKFNCAGDTMAATSSNSMTFYKHDRTNDAMKTLLSDGKDYSGSDNEDGDEMAQKPPKKKKLKTFVCMKTRKMPRLSDDDEDYTEKKKSSKKKR